MTPAATAFQNELLSHSSVEQHLQTHKALLKEMHRICLPILNTTEIDYISYTKQYEDKMIHYNLNSENAYDCAGVDVHRIVLYKAHTFFH